MIKRKAICLLSDGFDSPIATYLIERQGIEVIGLNFNNSPFIMLSKKELKKTYDNKNNPINSQFKSPIYNIAQKLVDSFRLQTSFSLYQMDHGNDLAKIISQVEYQKIICVLCKRLMLRKAERIAEKENADYIVTGEILGEQASQTIINLINIESALKSKKLIRPNIGLNKKEIISMSREIGTYQFSEMGAKFTCSAVQNKPSTSASSQSILNSEEKLHIDLMINESLKSIVIHNFTKIKK